MPSFYLNVPLLMRVRIVSDVLYIFRTHLHLAHQRVLVLRQLRQAPTLAVAPDEIAIGAWFKCGREPGE